MDDNANVETQDNAPEVETENHEIDTELAAPEAEDVLDENEDESSADSEEDVEEGEEETPKDSKVKKNGFKKRIDKLNKRLSDKDRDIEYWKAKALAGESAPKDEPESEARPNSNGKPIEDEFDSHADYIEALTDWKVEQTLSKREETQKKTQAAKSWENKIQDFASSTEDFEEVMSDLDGVKVSDNTTQAILNSDLGVEVLYHLGKNPELATKLASLDDISAIKEIGRIEAEITNSKEEKPKTKKTTKAPMPISTLRGSAKVRKDINDPDIPQADFEAIYRERTKNRR